MGNLTVTSTGNTTQAANATIAMGALELQRDERRDRAGRGQRVQRSRDADQQRHGQRHRGQQPGIGPGQRDGDGSAVGLGLGNISQVANTTLTVGGASTFNATNGSITLDQTTNAFTGNVSLLDTGSGNLR